jgi:hypothetical protein
MIEMEITLEDVEVAIKILNEFMNRQKKIMDTMRRLGLIESMGYRYRYRMEDFVAMAFNQVMQKPVEPTTTTPPSELTETEIMRMREIAEKIKREENRTSVRRGYV